MKKKISISISTETFEIVRSNVDGNVFRNSSHFIEYAINKLIEEDETFKSKGNMPRRGVKWLER